MLYVRSDAPTAFASWPMRPTLGIVYFAGAIVADEVRSACRAISKGHAPGTIGATIAQPPPDQATPA